MHISDLHRSSHDPISNEELVSALVSDRDRYSRENTPVAAPEAIIVSGDLVQGVPLDTPNHERQLLDQYAVAEALLDELSRRFLDGDRSRLIMVPGNHDINWNVAFGAMQEVPATDIPDNLSAKLFNENTEYRWDWKTRTLYRVSNAVEYERRLHAFWKFFEQFYSGVPGLLSVRPDTDANLFELCDRRIAVAAFNSCHGNDCFASHGMIPRKAIAKADLDLRDTGRVYDLRVAVWHHSVEGPPYRTDYMDIDIVRGMIGRGFRLGLYGHQHKTQITPQQIWLPDQERMAVISAGSLCAGVSELPTGVFRQYNILEIAPDFRSVRTHVRSMAVSNLFLPGSLQEFGGASFATLEWKPPLNPVGLEFESDKIRTRATIEAAEYATKNGNPAAAVALLRNIDLPADSYQRSLILESAKEAEDWDTILKITAPPLSIEELVKRVVAALALRQFGVGRDTLKNYSKSLCVPKAIETDLQHRLNAEERIRK